MKIQREPWWRRHFMAIVAAILVLNLTRIGSASWYKYVIFAGLIFVTVSGVHFYTARRSRALQVGAVFAGFAFLALVWLAQRSEVGKDALLVCGVASIMAFGARIFVALASSH